VEALEGRAASKPWRGAASKRCRGAASDSEQARPHHDHKPMADPIARHASGLARYRSQRPYRAIPAPTGPFQAHSKNSHIALWINSHVPVLLNGDDLCADAIQKVAVMRYSQDRTLEVLQCCLKDFY